uniref:Uncharacterized protein n=1 Tax=uncultured Candidatus Melainabacteria bacterium TaxID=2682970 RepID=A0A650EJ06_9BACT|nr:hypothetical protein Melaina855_0560 [uncultured Candidatus Melainabacteria bacterium]
MTPISAIGKYLDQPLLTAKINKYVPAVFTIAGSGILLNQINNAPKEKRVQTGLKTGIILAATAISAINAPKIAAYITKKELAKPLAKIQEDNAKLITEYIEKNNISNAIKTILNKAKTKILSPNEISQINTKEHKEFLNKLIPPPENIKAKDIFKEIGWLSIYGAIPVAGGISGGIIADKLTEKNWKKKIPNKINEGIYQYLANIFLCNIGAGAALGLLEKFNIKSKSARCIGMVTGIILTGVIGGSTIANYIGKNFINPTKSNETRTPELLDLGLHTDDIATVSLLSGLKWIEPSLPLLYSISGYRAGIGYRNHKTYSQNEQQTHFLRTKC